MVDTDHPLSPTALPSLILGVLDVSGPDRLDGGRHSLIGSRLAGPDGPVASWLVPGEDYLLVQDATGWRVAGPDRLAEPHHLIDRRGLMACHVATEDGIGGVTLMAGQTYRLSHQRVGTEHDGAVDQWTL